MSLDESITAGQPGHISDHEVIHGRINRLELPVRAYGIHRALSLHATERCVLLMSGDSRPEGTGLAALEDCYRYKLQTALRDLYGADEDTGRGYIPCHYGNGEGWSNEPVETGSTITVRNFEGLGNRSVALKGSGDMVTWELHGTDMVLCYASINGGGTSEYRINGGSWVEVDHTNGGSTLLFQEEALAVSLGVEDDYTIEWRWKTNGAGFGPNPVVEGIVEINGDPDAGIVVLDGAHGGYRSNNLVLAGFTHNIPRQVEIHGIRGLLIDVLTNDWQTGAVTPAESKTTLQTWIDLYQGAQEPTDPYSDVVFLSPWEPRAPIGTPVADWSDYRDIFYELASENDFVHVLDTRRHLPEPDAPGDIPTTTDGYFDFLALHPEEVGHEVIARAWLEEITPGPSSNYYTDPLTAQYQPLDSDLTAIAALSTQSVGRSLLTASSVASLQSTLGIGKRLSSAPSGALSETIVRDLIVAGTSPLTSGTLRLVGIELPIGQVITSITWVSAGQAAVSPTNWWFCLLDSSRVTLRKTADQTSTAWAANTAKTVNLASTYTTTYSGTYYLGIVMAAATAITVHAYTGNATLNALAPIRAGNTSDTGLTTPVDFNPAGAITSSQNVVYAYVS